jgi:hypothetical protein
MCALENEIVENYIRTCTKELKFTSTGVGVCGNAITQCNGMVLENRSEQLITSSASCMCFDQTFYSRNVTPPLPHQTLGVK